MTGQSLGRGDHFATCHTYPFDGVACGHLPDALITEPRLIVGDLYAVSMSAQ